MLSDIDKIEDDQEFMETENDFIRDYCIEHNFALSEENMNEIKNRGMEDAFEFWKNEFETMAITEEFRNRNFKRKRRRKL